jgi:hypothetical protein
MNELPSRQELCLLYKAIFRALIDYHGIKHSWIATRIGMRDDSFSRWFRTGRRSLTMEEMKLFCEALKVSSEAIDHLLYEAVSFRESQISMADHVARSTANVSARNLTVLFGQDGFVQLMFLINDYIPEEMSGVTVET